jgi:quinol monooxygenase YgiN
MDSYGLASKVTSLPGKREELAEALMEVSRLVFLSNGCLSYVVSKVDSEENALFVTQFWKNEEVRRSALSLPGYFELISRCHQLMADVEETQLRPLSN